MEDDSTSQRKKPLIKKKKKKRGNDQALRDRLNFPYGGGGREELQKRRVSLPVSVRKLGILGVEPFFSKERRSPTSEPWAGREATGGW